MARDEAQARKPIPKIRGTQIGLANPDQIDQIKADMLGGRFAYHEQRGQLAGVRDPRGTYYVKVGHHRMAAALEIHWETGDATFVHQLIHWGLWDNVLQAPFDGRPMPGRRFWAVVRNWLGI